MRLPFYQKAAGTAAALELVLDTQGCPYVGYFVSSSGDAVHDLAVSGDGVTFHDIKTITFSGGGAKEEIEHELTLPWRYVRLKTVTEVDHVYELTAKGG